VAKTLEQPTVRVKTRWGFAAPTWSCERGDEIEVPVADARRMIARGAAAAVDENDPRLKGLTEEDRKVEHTTVVHETVRVRLGLEAPAPIKR
jgi:hypothetical protein